MIVSLLGERCSLGRGERWDFREVEFEVLSGRNLSLRDFEGQKKIRK
jgi:hypothetical protein